MKLKSNETGIRAMWKAAFSEARQTDRRNPGHISQRLESIPDLLRLTMLVRAETDLVIQKEVEAWERLSNGSRNLQDQKFVFDLGKYLIDGYKVRRGCEQEPERLNSPMSRQSPND